MDPEKSICDLCQGLLHPELWPTTEKSTVYEHYPSIQKLYDSAVSGCRFCVTVLQMGWECYELSGRLADLDPALPRSPPGYILGREHKALQLGSETYSLEITGSMPSDPLNPPDSIAVIRILRWAQVTPLNVLCRYAANIQTFRKEPSLHSLFSEELVRFPNSLELVSTDRPRIIQRINSWVQKCEYKGCCREHFAAQPRQLPTRLLKIGETALQLVSARGTLPPSTVYTTLSHCWGGQPKVQLFSHTRVVLERGIPLASLPQTFRDACRVTALLGIPYIWIDSMCIIQDDTADWAREAPTMASVYGYSFLCICSLDAPNSESGLFSDRELATGVACYAYATNRRYGEENALIVLRRYDPFLRADRGVANSRAWIFQERLLAPRTVFFGSDDVYWECACFAVSDLNPSGSVSYRDKSTVSIIRRRLKETFTKAGAPMNNLFRQRLWHTIVKEYTSNNVTVATDRLIAFSGIAQHLCNLAQDSAYLAGFLGNSLVESLCWIPLVSQLTTTGSPSIEADNGIAPSWSWAKLNCPILGSYHFISPFGRKILASASYDAVDFPDPFSHRVSGKILVKGLAIPPGSLGWTEYSATELADGSLLSQCSILHHDWTMGMPFISDNHGYRETLSDDGLALPHLTLEADGEHHRHGIALFLDEPEKGSARESLEKSWLLQVSRNSTFHTRNQLYVWRIGLIVNPITEPRTCAMNGLGGNNVLSCRRIGVWLFREPPLVNGLDDPTVEWVEDRHQNPADAMTPILAKWLRGLGQIEAEIY